MVLEKKDVCRWEKKREECWSGISSAEEPYSLKNKQTNKQTKKTTTDDQAREKTLAAVILYISGMLVFNALVKGH